eukprot:2605212-Amphidinium_carterae.1
MSWPNSTKRPTEIWQCTTLARGEAIVCLCLKSHDGIKSWRFRVVACHDPEGAREKMLNNAICRCRASYFGQSVVSPVVIRAGEARDRDIKNATLWLKLRTSCMIHLFLTFLDPGDDAFKAEQLVTQQMI